MTCEHRVPIGDMQVWVGTVTPPPYACAFCEVQRLQEELERYRGIADSQAKLLAELPPSAEQLILAQMDAAVARAELTSANEKLERMRPIYEETMLLYGSRCQTYGFCEQCFDRCGDCGPPHYHREDCPGHGAEDRLDEAVRDARNKESE